jgi:hypothetical protein
VTKIVLLAVAAAWAAVLLPPLLRGRSENRPGSSVSDFNRQLSSLQRSVPTRGMGPMRSMARPLAQSPLVRPAAPGRPGQPMQRHASLHIVQGRDHTAGHVVYRRTHGEPGVAGRHEVPMRRQTHVRRSISTREEVRRRRTNVVFVLTIATLSTLFLAATTKADAMMYAFAISFLALCGYCYKLVQIRQQQEQHGYSDGSWFRAA